MTTNVAVTVTPTAKSGNEVDCNITGAQVVNNAIWLPRGDDYEITFTLVPGNGVAGWAAAPFANQTGSCPRSPGVNPPCSGFKFDKGNPVINVDGTGGRSVTHYRLNFNAGGTCDPIIIVG